MTDREVDRRKPMINFIKNFRKDENGAVTVDWVVLTAAVVGLAVAAYTTIETNSQTLIDNAAARVALENDF
jgi:Flp pilus assembly pilin Flp